MLEQLLGGFDKKVGKRQHVNKSKDIGERQGKLNKSVLNCEAKKVNASQGKPNMNPTNHCILLGYILTFLRTQFCY